MSGSYLENFCFPHRATSPGVHGPSPRAFLPEFDALSKVFCGDGRCDSVTTEVNSGAIETAMMVSRSADHPFTATLLSCRSEPQVSLRPLNRATFYFPKVISTETPTTSHLEGGSRREGTSPRPPEATHNRIQPPGSICGI